MAAGPGAAGAARVSSGRDLSCVPEVAGALGAVARQGFDFLCLPLFHPRHRREFLQDPARARPGPQTRSDLVLAGRDWNTLIVGKLSPWIRPDSELEHERRNSERALRQELDFGAYLGLAAHLVPLRGGHNPNLARGLSAHLGTGHHSTQFWVQVPLLAPEDTRDDLVTNWSVLGVTGLYWGLLVCTGSPPLVHTGPYWSLLVRTGQFWVQVPLLAPEDTRDDLVTNEAPPEAATAEAEEKTWMWWHKFRTLCDYNKRVALALEVGPDLPSAPALARWLGEPVRAAVLPTRLFLTNKKGFPVLGRGHQRLLAQLLKLDVQLILQGAPRHGGRPLGSYLQYLEHLGQHRPPPSAYELYARGYEDYLQSPLQPLMDNLESQTYEVFEKDPIKYSQYQQAIYKCLLDRVPEDERDTNVQVVMVLGAGRGPLVAATLRAARQAGARVRIYAVEKNPNAVVTLENWQYEEWGAQVRVVSGDMRSWDPPEGADVVVSELLGSFGDNELSPECLDGAGRCLKEGGVSIPQSYTSFLAPVSSSKLHNEVRNCREHDRHPEAQFETPYVVRLHNFHQLAPPLPVFTFSHPSPGPAPEHSRFRELSWPVEVGTVLHGFAGYFSTSLYQDVGLSICPDSHSPGLFSWFPIFFPIKQPMPIRAGETVSVAFWRVATPTKVWYEWAVTSPACSALHNPIGRSYTIGL